MEWGTSLFRELHFSDSSVTTHDGWLDSLGMFVDDVRPWVVIDLPVDYVAGETSVWLPLKGGCGDVGVGAVNGLHRN